MGTFQGRFESYNVAHMVRAVRDIDCPPHMARKRIARQAGAEPVERIRRRAVARLACHMREAQRWAAALEPHPRRPLPR